MPDALDRAVATAAEPAERRARGNLALSSGRVVSIDVPVPMSVAEVLELVTILPGMIGQLTAMAQAGGGRIALPDGRLHPVPRAP